jgi:hypothetical protein
MDSLLGGQAAGGLERARGNVRECENSQGEVAVEAKDAVEEEEEEEEEEGGES